MLQPESNTQPGDPSQVPPSIPGGSDGVDPSPSAADDEADDTGHQLGDCPNWIVQTLAELSQACGVSATTVQNWRNKGMPVEADGSYNLYKIARWKCDREFQRRIERMAQQLPDGADLMISNGDSPALEAYRWQKAILAGFDVEERRRTVVRVSEVNELFFAVAKILRESHETIQRQFGADAHAILEDALREAAVEMANRFPAALENERDDPEPEE